MSKFSVATRSVAYQSDSTMVSLVKDTVSKCILYGVNEDNREKREEVIALVTSRESTYEQLSNYHIHECEITTKYVDEKGVLTLEVVIEAMDLSKYPELLGASIINDKNELLLLCECYTTLARGVNFNLVFKLPINARPGEVVFNDYKNVPRNEFVSYKNTVDARLAEMHTSIKSFTNELVNGLFKNDKASIGMLGLFTGELPSNYKAPGSTLKKAEYQDAYEHFKEKHGFSETEDEFTLPSLNKDEYIAPTMDISKVLTHEKQSLPKPSLYTSAYVPYGQEQYIHGIISDEISWGTRFNVEKHDVGWFSSRSSSVVKLTSKILEIKPPNATYSTYAETDSTYSSGAKVHVNRVLYLLGYKVSVDPVLTALKSSLTAE